jgi:hypothetical protein
MESRTAWILLAALAELARRRPVTEPGDNGEYGFSEFAADEVAAELHLTPQSAAEQIWYARQVVGWRAWRAKICPAWRLSSVLGLRWRSGRGGRRSWPSVFVRPLIFRSKTPHVKPNTWETR